jgi:large subunit ribosomal protein L6
MSRIGKQPIEIPEGIEVNIDDKNIVTVKGSKGELQEKINSNVNIEKKDKEIIVSVEDVDNKKQKSLWGLSRTLISNMIEGLIKGYEKKLEVNGVGYRVALAGKKITLNVGYSNPVDFELPENVDGSVEGNVITLSSINKQAVGQAAARIRKIRKPEPYKGKGIKYIDEVIIRKAGKAAKSAE